MKTNMLVKQIVAGLAVAALIGSASVALAATDVILSGSVAAITTLTSGGDTALGGSLGTEAVAGVTVATITERNNVTLGYTVTMTTASSTAATEPGTNITTLRRTGDLTTTPIPYTMTYGGTTVALDGAPGTQVFDRGTAVNTPDGVVATP